MKTYRAPVGEKWSDNAGEHERLRDITFKGDLLWTEVFYDDERGSRGNSQELYRDDKGRYLLWQKDWSMWQGEPTKMSIEVIPEEELKLGGQYEYLGRQIGLQEAVPLDDYLADKL